MARPKSETEKTMISLRVDSELLAQIDAHAAQIHCDRTTVLTDAAQHYLETTKCEICGALIPKSSKFCPVCGNKLYSHDEIFKAAKIIRDRIVKEKNLFVGDMDDGMYAFYPVSETWFGNQHFFEASLTVYTADGDVGGGIGENSNFRITMDEIVRELNGDMYTVDINKNKKIDVKIRWDKIKCPKCGNLNYPDKPRCDTCNTTLNKELAETEKNLSKFMTNELMKTDKKNKK